MSVDISFQGSKKKSFFSRELSCKKFSETLHSIAKHMSAECRVLPENKFELDLCPNGIIEVMFDRGNIEGGTQTSLAGPGFHKATIDFLDTLSIQLSAEFDVEDEARYANRRNFKELQSTYISFLNSLLNTFLKDYMDKNTAYVATWLSKKWQPADQEGIITPMGKFTHDDFSFILQNNRLEELATNYFIWYNITRDAWFHRGLALYWMWNDFCWVKPRNQEEAAIAEKILFHLDAAKKIDPSIPLPVEEWQEIVSLTGKNLAITSQNNLKYLTKIGYRRNNIIVQYPRGWEVQLPGNMLAEEEENTEIYWDDLRNFRMNSHAAEDEYQFVFQKN